MVIALAFSASMSAMAGLIGYVLTEVTNAFWSGVDALTAHIRRAVQHMRGVPRARHSAVHGKHTGR